MREHREMLRSGKWVIAGLLALAVVASIAVASIPAVSPGIQPAHAAAAAPVILPTPQHESTRGVTFSLSGSVAVVVGKNTDAAAKTLLAGVVKRAGGSVAFVPRAPKDRPALYLGTIADNPAIADATTAIGVDDADGLTDEGYAIASGTRGGQKILVLTGRDATGTYYAVQSVRQVVRDGVVPALEVRDWPLMPVRGAIEGFYGVPWTAQARLDQLAFYGRHKLNDFIYSPKDDPYLRAQWRDLYPEAGVTTFRELISQANAHHVNFSYALSPGNDVCYSSDEDFDATIAKFDQLRALGVTSFYIALDDIPPDLHCQADIDEFTASGDRKLADAQAHFLNRIVDEYITPNHLQPLRTVPTDFSGSASNGYKEEFGTETDPSIRIQWTGEGVFSDQISSDSVARAVQTYDAEHFEIWDNFPVNDGQRDRLFLNPLTGRDANLYQQIDGITANPMIQPYASMIALAGYGDYDWNGPKYDPATTQRAIITELAGPEATVRTALEAFVDLNQNWMPYRSNPTNAPELSANVAEFWKAYAAGDASKMTPLQDRLDLITTLPTTLGRMAEPGFAADAKPWLTAAAQWASALSHEIDMLRAIKEHRGNDATNAMLAANADRARAVLPTVADLTDDGKVAKNMIVPSVGDGVLASFFNRAVAAYDGWLKSVPAYYPATASSSMTTYSGGASRITDGDLDTSYVSNQTPAQGDAVTLDLGSVVTVGSVLIRQSASDSTPGDMIYDAKVEYSTDGSSWTDAGEFDTATTIDLSLDAPEAARYVRIVAAGPNPGGQWVQIREFQVFPPSSGVTTDLSGAKDSTADLAFDATVTTAFKAATKPIADSHLTRTFPEPRQIGSIAIVGKASGRLQVKTQAGWQNLLTLDSTQSFQEAVVKAKQISAARILFTPGSAAPTVYEFAVRPGPPVGSNSGWIPQLLPVVVSVVVLVVLGGIVTIFYRRRMRRRRRPALVRGARS
ncbi:MAG: beta-N-acetylglucosaminidase domain-containing protein [Microbacteriaceae bacterium]